MPRPPKVPKAAALAALEDARLATGVMTRRIAHAVLALMGVPERTRYRYVAAYFETVLFASSAAHRAWNLSMTVQAIEQVLEGRKGNLGGLLAHHAKLVGIYEPEQVVVDVAERIGRFDDEALAAAVANHRRVLEVVESSGTLPGDAEEGED